MSRVNLAFSTILKDFWCNKRWVNEIRMVVNIKDIKENVWKNSCKKVKLYFFCVVSKTINKITKIIK